MFLKQTSPGLFVLFPEKSSYLVEKQTHSILRFLEEFSLTKVKLEMENINEKEL